jgi:hypothetical protein
MSRLDETSSLYASFGFNPGYSDLLAICRDSPRETDIDGLVSAILPEYIVPAESFSLQLEQSSVSRDRRAGEGADPNSFTLAQVSLRGSLKMPLLAQATGYIDWSLAALWDLALLGYWGTSSAAMSRIVSNTPGVAIAAGASTMIVDNIADFLPISRPFNLAILPESGSSEISETVVVTGVNKSTRTLTFSSGTTQSHTPNSTILAARITTNQAPIREPAFSLFSLREGLLSPCLVDKITIDADAESGITVSVEFAALKIKRATQIDLRSEYTDLMTAFSRITPPIRKVDPMMIQIKPLSANSGNFGLATAIQNPLMEGFQGSNLLSTAFTGFSITIDNQLQEVYTSHSLSNDPEIRQMENSYPFALVSQGRKISGSLKYKNPIAPWAALERLAGPSSLNGGGMEVDFSDCVIRLPEIAWSPSTSNGDVKSDQTRELKWSLVSETYDSSPVLAAT